MPSVITGQGFLSVQDAAVEPGPTWTNLDHILDQASLTWEALSLQRWGPAMDDDRPWVPAEDDQPGIVIDTPDRGRMMAALRSRLSP